MDFFFSSFFFFEKHFFVSKLILFNMINYTLLFLVKLIAP